MEKTLQLPAGIKKRGLTRAQREARRAYMIILPYYIYIAFWSLLPLLIGFFLGFTEFDGLSGLPKWVGLENFRTFFATNEYLILLWRQIWIGMICLFFNTVLSFLLGLALNVNFRIRGFFRTTVYVPSVAAVSTTTAVVVALLSPVDGGLNKFLEAIGVQPIVWNYSQFWMVFWIVVYFVWRSIGPAAIIWLGGLQSINPSLYEAARVDGAKRWQEIRYITIPGLKYIAGYIILTGVINVMQMFDVVMFISRGNPYGKTDVLMYRIYRDGIQSFNLGMAGAQSIVLGIVTIIFALMYFRFIVRSED
ncbi:MAG: sugar ABC transporter permease [Clostridiales bacterium]|jgi:multiple sugar transport system permease protein|nr:sugar ABC transporter permease [Clostridiales bacterium]